MKRRTVAVSVMGIVLAALMVACQPGFGAQPQEDEITQEPTHEITQEVTAEPTSTATDEPTAPEQEMTQPPTEAASGSITDFQSLHDALDAAGASVHLGDRILNPMFSAQGYGFTVNGENLIDFQYDSADALNADLDKALTAQPMDADTHLWKSGALLVEYAGTNADVIALMDK